MQMEPCALELSRCGQLFNLPIIEPRYTTGGSLHSPMDRGQPSLRLAWFDLFENFTCTGKHYGYVLKGHIWLSPAANRTTNRCEHAGGNQGSGKACCAGKANGSAADCRLWRDSGDGCGRSTCALASYDGKKPPCVALPVYGQRIG